MVGTTVVAPRSPHWLDEAFASPQWDPFADTAADPNRVTAARVDGPQTGMPIAPAAASSSVVWGRFRELRAWLAATKGHGIWIVCWSLVGWIGTLLAPALIDQPFMLMLLAPRALFVALAVDSVDFATFVLLGTLRLGVTDASYFIVGRRFPKVQQRRTDRLARSLRGRVFAVLVRISDGFCRWICDHGLKAGTVLFLRPNAKYLAIAGAYGVSPVVAGASSVSGTIVYLACFHLGIGLLL